MKKKMLAILLAGTMVMATLAGCGVQENKEVESSKVEESKTEESKVEEPKEEVKDYTGQTLRIGWWGGDARNEQTMTIVDEFKKQYPGLEVQFEVAGYGDYFTRLNTQAAGGELPDVIQMDVTKIYSFADNEQLLDLTSFIEDGSIDMSKVAENVVGMGEMCGGNYGVATGVNGLALVYNPAILEEAGCTFSGESTISEFADIAQTVFEKTGSRIYSLSYDEIFFRSLGGDKFANGEEALGFTEEMLLEWFELIAQKPDYILTQDNMVETETNAQFATGEVWAIPDSSNKIVGYESGAGVQLDLTTIPKTDNATVEHPTYLKTAMYWCVAADTELAEIAVDFVNYFTNSTYVYDVCGVDRGVPISSGICEYLLPSLNETDQKTFAYVEYLKEYSTPVNIFTPAKSAEAMVPINELKEKIDYHLVTVDELPALVHEAYEKASAIISGAE